MGLKEIIGPVTAKAGVVLERELEQECHAVLIVLADKDVEVAISLYKLTPDLTVGLLEKMLEYLKDGQEVKIEKPN